ncbi:MFS transporter [Candidatus Curtissbacteria bacterium]|nr:MFS transporter [Candidatus Curtissbacteria bacterium]
MRKNFNIYFRLLAERHFLILILTILVGQMASAFLLLSLVTSVFLKTGSDFGVSGVILSLSMPALFLMALAGLISDIFDRKKIILVTNIFISVVVLGILLSIDKVFASISLSFLYFAGNSFFFPAVSAATAQLVSKNKLIYANSIFFLAMAGGQVLGFFLAAVVQFFAGNLVLLYISESLLLVCIALPLLLPGLPPRKNDKGTLIITLREIWKFFIYIFSAKTIWFYFLVLASAQGIIAFGATIAPGFFDKEIGLSIVKSPLFLFPAVAVGVTAAALFAHRASRRESLMVVLGWGIIGLGTTIVGVAVRMPFNFQILRAISFVYFIISAFGIIFIMIAARTILQKRVSHHFQGTVFGANFVVSSFLASLASPAAAGAVAFFDYSNVLIVGGIVFMIAALFVGLLLKRWKF